MMNQVLISREIVALGTSVKTDKNAVVISDIIASKDWYKDKSKDTNEYLKKLCPCMDHSNNDFTAQINYEFLQLNSRALKLVAIIY